MAEVELEPKQSGSRGQVLDHYTPLPLRYVWIVCLHLKIKIKIQIYSSSEWKLSSSNNPELTVLQGQSQPPLHGDVSSDFPQSPPFPLAFQHRACQLFAICHQAATTVVLHTALSTRVCDLAPIDVCDPLTGLFLRQNALCSENTSIRMHRSMWGAHFTCELSLSTRKLQDNSEERHETKMGKFKATTGESL